MSKEVLKKVVTGTLAELRSLKESLRGTPEGVALRAKIEYLRHSLNKFVARHLFEPKGDPAEAEQTLTPHEIFIVELESIAEAWRERLLSDEGVESEVERVLDALRKSRWDSRPAPSPE